eukprot:g4744.t1
MTETAKPVQILLEDLQLQSEKRPIEAVSDSFEFDLGNLLVSDPTPLSEDPDDVEHQLKSSALAPTRALLLELSRLPRPYSSDVISLPPSKTPLPRSKPLPTAKPLTKWESFAKQKGIKKRKKARKIWDESKGEWRRRFGYKRANDPNEVIILDAKSTDKLGESPFDVLKNSRNDRIKKQQQREMKNVQRLVKMGGKLPETVKLAAKLPMHGKGHPNDRKEMKGSLGTASRIAGLSTASMGKFDVRLEGESKDERVSKPKKRTLVSNKETSEKEYIKKLTQKMVKENSENILNTEKAMGYLEAENRKKRHQEKILDQLEDNTTTKRQRSQKKRSTRNGGVQNLTLPKMKLTTRQKKMKRRSRK